MPIITASVENPDELLNASMLGAGAKGRVERAATAGGTYSEITTFDLVAGTRSYTIYDLAGATDSWYRIRFSKSDGSSPSAYGDVFQAGDDTGGLLCDWRDVEQEMGTTLSANERESVIEKIRQVTTAVEEYCNRWFVPRPLSGTTTYVFHTEYGRKLHIPKGVRSITTLSIATNDQPETGGSYTTQSASTYYLDPPAWERGDWPALFVRMPNAGSRFYDAVFGASITGAFGWARVPYDIQGVAVRAVIRRYIGKAGGGATVAVGPEGTEFLLPDMSGSDRAVLDHYRQIVA